MKETTQADAGSASCPHIFDLRRRLRSLPESDNRNSYALQPEQKVTAGEYKNHEPELVSTNQ